MSNIKITADISQVLSLGGAYARAREIGVRRLTERGEQLVRAEAPEVTRNLKQGVSSEVKVGPGLLRGEVIVTARTGRLGRRKATLHLASGKTKQITLRAVPAFNYPEAVATGTGIYGPNKTPITPKKASVLLVPVNSIPTLDGKAASYIEADGKIYVVRRSIKGTRPNPYDRRAAARLESEAAAIYNRALADEMNP